MNQRHPPMKKNTSKKAQQEESKAQAEKNLAVRERRQND
jgi:hypothetical protein